MKVIKHKDKWYLQSETGYKEILLSTDIELQKDGVQSIDDEFLEWYIKNPSCEEVEIESWKIDKEWDKVHTQFNPIYPQKTKYKIIIPKEEIKEYWCKACGITQDEPFGKCHESHKHCSCELRIIPQEEPKFVTVNVESATGEDLGKVSYIPLPNVDYVPKQETLEEAANKIYPNDEYRNEYYCDMGELHREKFIEGAKWQQENSQSIVPYDAYNIEVFAIKPDENGKLFAYIGYKITNGNFHFNVVPFTEPQQERMYSEEDMIEFGEWMKILPLTISGFVVKTKTKSIVIKKTKQLLEIWFEQFKKK